MDKRGERSTIDRHNNETDCFCARSSCATILHQQHHYYHHHSFFPIPLACVCSSDPGSKNRTPPPPTRPLPFMPLAFLSRQGSALCPLIDFRRIALTHAKCLPRINKFRKGANGKHTAYAGWSCPRRGTPQSTDDQARRPPAERGAIWWGYSCFSCNGAVRQVRMDTYVPGLVSSGRGPMSPLGATDFRPMAFRVCTVMIVALNFLRAL